MRYRIEHLTEYRYARTAAMTQQVLRLSPCSETHQRVVRGRRDYDGVFPVRCLPAPAEGGRAASAS